MNKDSDALVGQIADVVMQVLAERGLLGSAGAPTASVPTGTACSLPHGMAAQGPPPKNELVQAGAERIGHAGEQPPTGEACMRLSNFIDHTLLKATANEDEIRRLCEDARTHKFASVCVNSAYVPLCKQLLEGSGVMVCTVVGFPLGSMAPEAKAFETADAVGKGADEVDMVINVGKLQSGDFKYVCDDIRGVVSAARGRTVKVIIETSYLSNDEIIHACVLSKAAGAHFVKTSTGFAGAGAKAEHVALMRRTVGKEMGVKASGGIRDCDSARQMIDAGANRLGVSASVAIVQGKKSDSSY